MGENRRKKFISCSKKQKCESSRDRATESLQQIANECEEHKHLTEREFYFISRMQDRLTDQEKKQANPNHERKKERKKKEVLLSPASCQASFQDHLPYKSVL